VRIAVRVTTDNRDTEEGLWLDAVRVDNVVAPACDRLVCLPPPDCSVPNAVVSGPDALCQHEPGRFEARGDYWGSGSFRYQWDMGDGMVLFAADPDLPVVHAFDTPGLYEVSFTSVREDDLSCFTTASHSTLVSARPRADAGPDVEAPALIGTLGFPAFVYYWTPEEGLDDRGKPSRTPTRPRPSSTASR